MNNISPIIIARSSYAFSSDKDKKVTGPVGLGNSTFGNDVRKEEKKRGKFFREELRKADKAAAERNKAK